MLNKQAINNVVAASANAAAAMLVGVFLAAPLAATATEPLVLRLSPPGSEDWQPLIFRSIERQTDYQVSTDPSGRPAYRAVSDCGAGLFGW